MRLYVFEEGFRVKEITSVHNPQIQQLRELQKAKARREQGLFLAESMKMVREAIELSLCRTLIVEEKRREEYADMMAKAQEKGCEVLLVTPAILQTLSEQKTPQGIMCTVEIPAQPQRLCGRLLVAMDGVQDPGNVGTILRTADAAGFDGALLSSACADLFGSKTLRATMGSVFRVPVMRVNDLPAALEELKARGYAVVATELGGEDFYTHCPHENAVLVIGSEGRGVSPEVRAAATHHLALPMRGGAESLNAAVAAGIMIYEMARNA